ncbi:hypothetical protein BXZ70DRAFT_911236 [Cristinia sonorae]|uniref:Uncharacterized protein n=1 Tax=Cristinia sonorae TaxID=1940300 RepID=A0A8K0UDN2_9AGAR|nr:hypothetical protein BXZ70DRAFT_911236 [Cristinia sonorae]
MKTVMFSIAALLVAFTSAVAAAPFSAPEAAAIARANEVRVDAKYRAVAVAPVAREYCRFYWLCNIHKGRFTLRWKANVNVFEHFMYKYCTPRVSQTRASLVQSINDNTEPGTICHVRLRSHVD